MTIAAAAATSPPAPQGDPPGTVDVDVSDLGTPANDTSSSSSSAPKASLGDRLAAAEQGAQRQREQKRAAVQKQKELEAELSKHKGSSEKLTKMEAAIARALEGDESALEELGAGDLFDRISAARLQPDETKARRQADKDKSELQKRIDKLEAERKQEREQAQAQARDTEYKAFVSAVKASEYDDLHILEDGELLGLAEQEAVPLRQKLGRNPSFGEIMAAVRDVVLPYHSRVIDLHKRREAKSAETAKAKNSTEKKPDPKADKKTDADEPAAVTGSLAGDRGAGKQPKLSQAERIERAKARLKDILPLRS